MSYYLIESKVPGMKDGSAMKVPLVIAPEKLIGPVQTSGMVINGGPGSQKQEWEFKADPAGSGYYFIKNEVNGARITLPSSPSAYVGSETDVTDADQCLWQFIQDPNGSGYCFISSLVNGDVIEIKDGLQEPGTGLLAAPLRSSNNAFQLWKSTFPSPITLPKKLSWLNLGTGTGTTGSDASECSFTASLEIKWDGSCHFWGSYTNRGDTFASTAPPQDFAVSIVVLDTLGNGYSFSWGGFVWSAPQAGGEVSWDYKGNSQVIADNWVPIALKNHSDYGHANQATHGTGLNDEAAPPDTVDTIFSLLQTAVSGAGGGSIGPMFSPTPDTIFYGWSPFPTSTTVASGGDVGQSGGTYPSGWVPSGSGSD
jgi:hypothetical protein